MKVSNWGCEVLRYDKDYGSVNLAWDENIVYLIFKKNSQSE